MQALGCPFLHGKGVGDDASWPPEKSILIFAVSQKEAQKLAKRFGHLAIVFVRRGRTPSLLFCAERKRYTGSVHSGDLHAE